MKLENYCVPQIYFNSTVFEALVKMSNCNVSALVVHNGEEGIVGIVSEKDYARKVFLKAKRSTNTQVKEIMSTQIIMAMPHDTLEHCMMLMVKNSIRHLPVIKDNNCFGFLSILDVASYLLDSHEELIDQLNKYITGSQFASPLLKKSNYLSAV